MGSPLWLLLGVVIAFAFGARWNGMQRARSDYANAKENLPAMRSAVWAGIGAMLRAAVLVVLAVVVLGLYEAHAIGDWRDKLTNPVPSPSPTNERARDGRAVCTTQNCAHGRGGK